MSSPEANPQELVKIVRPVTVTIFLAPNVGLVNVEVCNEATDSRERHSVKLLEDASEEGFQESEFGCRCHRCDRYHARQAVTAAR